CSSGSFAGAIFGVLAWDAWGPAHGRPAARIFGWLASDGGAPAPRRPAARPASCWGGARKGGDPPIRVSGGVAVRLRRYGLLLGVFLVCLLLLTVQTRGGETGRAADVVALLVTPIQGLLVKVHRGALGLWTTYVDWKAVRSENTVLRAEAERLKLQALQVEETRQENARLRRLLALRERLPLSALAGEVVGREAGGWVRTLTVNR